MTILDELLASLPAENVPVRHVLVGAHWTVVCSRYAGMAATMLAEGPHGHARVREVGRLQDKPAQALAELARSKNPLEVSIGVAAINSLLDLDETSAQELNAAQVLAERGRDRTVAIVGHFPFIEKLRPSVGELWVIELNPVDGEYPADMASELLPKADVIAITGSALINHTLDGLLALCRPASTVVVLGPSTPLSPVLFAHGATILSGTRVADEAAVLRTVAQGASFSQVEGARRLTLMKESIS